MSPIRFGTYALWAVLTISVVSSACTGSNDSQPNAVFVTTTISSTTTTIPPGGTTTIPEGSPILRGLCPDPLVVQLDGPIDFWALPWAAMLAIDGTSIGGSYNALMVHPANRSPTGIRLELRQIKPTNESVAEVLRNDRSAHLGVVSTDTSVAERSTAPLTYLTAPWVHDDRIITWDVNVERDAISIADMTPNSSVTFSGSALDPTVAYLLGTGLLLKSQLTPGPGMLQFGRFLDNPNDLLSKASFKRWQFLDETGWSPYPHAVVASPLAFAALRPCLEAFVPIFQQAIAEVTKQPARMIANLSEIAGRSGSPLDPTLAMVKLRAAIDTGIIRGVAGESDLSTVGEITQARMEQALRAEATSRRTRGLVAGSTSKIRAEAKSMINDLTTNTLSATPGG